MCGAIAVLTAYQACLNLPEDHDCRYLCSMLPGHSPDQVILSSPFTMGQFRKPKYTVRLLEICLRPYDANLIPERLVYDGQLTKRQLSHRSMRPYCSAGDANNDDVEKCAMFDWDYFNPSDTGICVFVPLQPRVRSCIRGCMEVVGKEQNRPY